MTGALGLMVLTGVRMTSPDWQRDEHCTETQTWRRITVRPATPPRLCRRPNIVDAMGRFGVVVVLVVATGCSGFAGSPSQSAGTAVDSQPAVNVPESTVTVTVTAVVDGDTIQVPTRTGPVTRSGCRCRYARSPHGERHRGVRGRARHRSGSSVSPRDRHERVVAR